MPTYLLRRIWTFANGRRGTIADREAFEADTLGQAVELARIRSLDTEERQLVSAVLLGPERQVVWSLRLPNVVD